MLGSLILASSLGLIVNPKPCQEPCSIVATVKVEPSEKNEKLVIVVESPNSPFYRRSELDLHPDTQRLMLIRYPEVPRGDYLVTVTLHTKDGIAEAEARGLRVTRRKGYRR